MNSTRLPGKALLPVGGTPAVILAARRAGNRGCPIRVATSWEPSDDRLVDALTISGIPCFRGSLDDTLDRMAQAVADVDDQTIVIRLTADNMVPDGSLLDELIDEFDATGGEYLQCGGPGSGLPYGVSAELMRARQLRKAAATATELFDREHVTPWIRRHCAVRFYNRHAALRMEHFRCTIDSFDDYQTVSSIFGRVTDPIAANWRELADLLVGAPFQPITSRAIDELVLGGVQLGMAYGIANLTGRPSTDTASALIKGAITNGATWIDTAHAYGESETVCGRTLATGWQGRARIVTKLDPLRDLPHDADHRLVEARVNASVFQSLAALRTERLDSVLLHRAAHLDDWGGAAWNKLLELRTAGFIGTLGVSVSTPTELMRALDQPQVGHVQFACNVLDHRWDSVAPELVGVRAKRPLTVHVRSAFLQGLLLLDNLPQWRQAHVADGGAVIAWLDAKVRRLGRLDRADLCLAYVRGLPFVDGVVIGMETVQQLTENLIRFDRPPLTTQEISMLSVERPRLDERSLDPGQWSSA
jgi:spore coat polysaccharide biosynthesis protein SpsF (cytidylyltransferase family)/aryl-alcohol dehydrogenase-like predicted oxidoreductase